MPGAYHTEVVLLGSNRAKVYLLDMKWEKPSTMESSLQLTFHSSFSEEANCKPMEAIYYLCSFPKRVDLTKKGKLTVNSKREGQEGVEVSYDLPSGLQIFDDGHGGKH